MPIGDTRVSFNYGASIPSTVVPGAFYIASGGGLYPELYLAVSASTCQHIGALHVVTNYAALPVTADGNALFYTSEEKSLYRYNTGTSSYDLLNEGQVYTADESTLELVSNQFSIKDAGVTTVKLADDAVTDAKLANQTAYTIKANNTSSAANPTGVRLVDLVANGYSKTADTGALSAADTLNIMLSKIENAITNVIKSASSLTDGYVVGGNGDRNVVISPLLVSDVVTQTNDASAANLIIFSDGANKTVKSSGIGIATSVTDSDSFVPTAGAVTDYAQPVSESLTNISALSGAAGFLVKTGASSWGLDTVAYIPLSQRGAVNGVATIGEDGKIPTEQLPSYVDDIIDLICVCEAYTTAPPEEDGAFYFNTTVPATLYYGEAGSWVAVVPTEVLQFGTSVKIYTYGNSVWDSGVTPVKSVLYVDDSNAAVYRWSGSALVQISSGSVAWGTITGTLSDQTDLQNALNVKISGPNIAVSGNVMTYTDTTGKLAQDSGIASSNLVTSTTTLTANQLIVGNSNKVLKVLAAGTEGQVLKITSGAPAWVSDASYTLPAATSSALGGIMLGYSASGAAIPVTLDGTNKAYVTLTSDAINAAKSGILTSASAITLGQLISSAGSYATQDSGIAVTDVVTANATLASDQFVLGNGNKAVKASGYTFVTTVDSSSTGTQIPSASAVYTAIQNAALVWGSF